MSEPRDQRRAHRLAQLLIVLLPTLLLGSALFGDRALVGLATGALSPWRDVLEPGLAERLADESLALTADKTLSCWPLLSVTLERLLAGESADWNALNLLGVPLLAQATQGALHPPNWTALVLSMERAFGWTAWLQAVLAGLFMFAFVRELGAGPLAGLCAGVTFMLGGYLSARWHWYPITGAALYLPLALLGIEKLFKGGRAVWMAVTAAAVGGAFLSGFLQGAVHLCYAGGIWGLVRLVQGWRATEGVPVRAFGASLRCAMALVVGLCLGAPQLLPTLGYVAEGDSARDVAAPEVIREHLAMRPVSLAAGLLSAEPFGHPVDLAAHPVPQLATRGALRVATCKPMANGVENALFLGVAPLLLALLGACVAVRGRGLLLGLFVAGPLLALDTPLLLGVCELPGLASGDPRRFLSLFTLGGAGLAALGVDRLSQQGPPRWLLGLSMALLLGALGGQLLIVLRAEQWAAWLAPSLASALGVSEADVLAQADGLHYDRRLLLAAVSRLTTTLGAITLLLVLARFPRRRAVAVLLLVLLGVVELAEAGARNAVTTPADGAFVAPPGLALLQDASADPSAPGRVVRFHPDGADGLADIPLPPNTGLPFDVRDLCGYWALAPRRTVELFEAIEPGCTHQLGLAAFTRVESLQHPALELLDVDRILSSVPLELPGWSPAVAWGDAWLLARESRGSAWLASSRDGLAEETLRDLASGRVDVERVPLDEWLVDARDLALTGPPAAATGAPRGTVRVRRPAPEHVVLEVEADGPGVVVVSEAWMPGWRATRDGVDVTVWPAWHALMAVEIEPGRQLVELRYTAPLARAGVGAGGVGLGLLALLLVGAWRQRGPRVRDGSAS